MDIVDEEIDVINGQMDGWIDRWTQWMDRQTGESYPALPFLCTLSLSLSLSHSPVPPFGR